MYDRVRQGCSDDKLWRSSGCCVNGGQSNRQDKVIGVASFHITYAVS